MASRHRHGGTITRRVPIGKTAHLGTGLLTGPAATTLDRRESMLSRLPRRLPRPRTKSQTLRPTLTAYDGSRKVIGLTLSTWPGLRLLLIRVSHLARARVPETNPVNGPPEQTPRGVPSTKLPVPLRKKTRGTTAIPGTAIQITMVLAEMGTERPQHRSPDPIGCQIGSRIGDPGSEMARLLVAAGSLTRVGLPSRTPTTAGSVPFPLSATPRRVRRRVRAAAVGTRLESPRPTALRCAPTTDSRDSSQFALLPPIVLRQRALPLPDHDEASTTTAMVI